MMKSINPATGELLAEYPAPSEGDVGSRLDEARAAQQQWRREPVARRAELLRRVGKALRAKQNDYAMLMTLEMGKPLHEARAEVEKCAWNFDFYGAEAPKMLKDRVVPSGASDSRVVYDPLGLVLAVMPWNYPFWQAMRAAAPILAGGNAVVLKHASNVPQCALALERVFKEAGAPEGLFTVLLVGSDRVANLIADPRIAAVTFTGSTSAGQAIASEAGRALKKQVLELGGSDPFIVLADADIPAAAAVAVKARFQNTGQSCIAAKRFIVEDRVADAFADAVCQQVSRLVIGDPRSSETTLGPMAQIRLRDDLHAQVRTSVSEGAVLRMGGKPVAGPGAFYEPTVLDHVTPDMTVARLETFGPAASILRVRDADEAVAVANGTEFGLGAALWTSGLERARTLSRVIDAGAVFINGMVASDPRLPFGGTKRSGYGRELGEWGLHEFCNVKTVWTGPAR
jgi:succinate-semialdehyde dehydrogenase/glutarate-semialdehyde dehydrogenase